MVYLLVGLVALVVSGVTLFTGFGLGTLLLPTFAFFFPVSMAVAATAIVHGANNFFKLILFHKTANRRVALRFGVPAILAAPVGAWLLTGLSGLAPLYSWQFGDRVNVITPIGLVMGVLIVGFALLDLLPWAERLSMPVKWLPLGGVLSGFFGGLSGHQGALRAAFLRRLDLSPTAFASTQAVIGFFVDAVRLTVYAAAYAGGRMPGVQGADQWALVATATLCAFAGVLIGRRLLPRATVGALRYLTGAALLFVGVTLGAGVI
jgi:uncharacterized membrane protein YfcA